MIIKILNKVDIIKYIQTLSSVLSNLFCNISNHLAILESEPPEMK